MTNTKRARRARTVGEFQSLGGKLFVGDEIMRAIASYKPRPTDVIISPFGKCGTTWLQQTFHTLRTGGDMDFDDISRVVPWIETATALEIDLEAPQRGNPRGFKSHLSYDHMPKGARYVVAFRDAKDAFVSMYRFMEGWFMEPGAVAMEDFYVDWSSSADGGHYWQHLLSWWVQRDNPGVLLFTYEHMIADPLLHIRRLAEFCDIPLDDDLLALTLERSSLAFMLDHEAKFADPMMRRKSEERCNLPLGGDSAKVRKGGVGGHKKELPPDVGAAIDRAWAEHIAPVTGFADYAALDAAVRRRNAA
ncbi:MAG: sulfotransferase domain-containing protein [Pseudomonadota bacterium]